MSDINVPLSLIIAFSLDIDQRVSLSDFRIWGRCQASYLLVLVLIMHMQVAYKVDLAQREHASRLLDARSGPQSSSVALEDCLL